MAIAAPPIVTLTMNPAIDLSAGFERLVPEEKLRCQAATYAPGGGGINVARAIHALGGDALALFPAGGPPGELLKRLLDAEGVRHRALPIAAWTRTNLNTQEMVTGRQFRFLMPGASLAEAEWRAVLATLATLSPAPRYLVVSGSLPPGVPVDFYAQVAPRAARAGTKVILDTSGEPLRRAVEHGVHLLKPSRREFEELTGEKTTDDARLRAAARRLIDARRCEILVLSLGADGVVWASASGGGRLRAPRVPVRSTVGAGDSLVAGIVLALSEGRALPDAIAHGVAAATASVMNPGTELCRAADVARLYGEIVAGMASSPSSS
jgi:6-phosphofructokinase 2